MNLHTSGFGIGQLAERTGVEVSTLRAWERRHGFPIPERLAGGHRRYSERDAQAVRDVVQLRQEGMPLHTALAQARERALAPRASIAATLRRAMPDVAPVLMLRQGMVAVSHAIEDEAATRLDRPLLIGSFQAERFWRRTEPRWCDLSATSLAVALAAGPRVRQRGTLWEVPIAATSPLVREWSVICEAPGLSACVVATERPGGTGDGRRFEVLWTTEPAAVREAARTALAIAIDAAPVLAEAVGDRLLQPAPVTAERVRSATGLMNRILGYLGASPPSR